MQETKNITIMSLLANCSTEESKRLLEKYNMSKPKNKKDLEFLLAKLYRGCDDKRQLEKDFAEIHPHKKFIQKYTTPKPSQLKEEEKIAPIPITNEIPNTKSEVVSNTDGQCTCSNCNNKSNFSNFNADESNTKSQTFDKDKLIVYGMFGIVSILALVLIAKIDLNRK
jgi:hypothetical protein